MRVPKLIIDIELGKFKKGGQQQPSIDKHVSMFCDKKGTPFHSIALDRAAWKEL